eukprot:TRINITY_DN32072_c0_g1_i1.p1 TRINITY_DN32072_c0_g1~~TRINITY_DN32072_c0_g1_i1.p1  ORF type:complete len:560 (+),score=190.93 TRINITY_DN32072_c0_g1_i1:208-1887(+)
MAQRGLLHVKVGSGASSPPGLPERSCSSAAGKKPAPVPSNLVVPDAARGVPQDHDPVDQALLQQLSDQLLKRAARASDEVVEAVRKRLPAKLGYPPMDALGGGDAAEQSLPVLLLRCVKEADEYVSQVRASGKTAGSPLADAGKQEQSKTLSEGAQKAADDLQKAIAARADAADFSEQLTAALSEAASGTNGSSAALREAIVPTRAKLQEAIREDLRQWIAEPAKKQATQCLSNEAFTQMSSAVDSALREMTTQGVDAVSKMLDDIGQSAESARLSLSFLQEVHRITQRELKARELTAAGQHAAGTAGGPKAALVQRLKAQVAPLHRSLDAVAGDVSAAGSSLERSRAAAADVERVCACSSRRSEGAVAATSSSADAGGGGLQAVTARALDALARGRADEALEKALQWDAEHQDARVLLVETVLERMSAAAGADGEPAQPDDVLARRDVRERMNGNLKLLLTVSLLQLAVHEDAPLSRVCSTLDWVHALLHLAGDDDAAYLAALERTRPRLTEQLEALAKGEKPATLAAAPPADRKTVAVTARSALKILSMLGRLRTLS